MPPHGITGGDAHPTAGLTWLRGQPSRFADLNAHWHSTFRACLSLLVDKHGDLIEYEILHRNTIHR